MGNASSGYTLTATSSLGLFDSLSDIPLTAGYTLRGSSGNTAEATSSLFVSAAGNVGIGKTNPGFRLSVAGNDPNISIEDTDGTTRTAKIRFATAGGIWQIGQDNTLSQNNLSFINTDNTTVSMMIQRSTGNVGIGLTAPAYKLEVNGSASTTNLYLPNTSSSALGVIYKGANRFIHNYADPTSDGQNTFIGLNAGNFTMGPGGGASYLGSYNTAVGYQAFASNTIGSSNTAYGGIALYSNTTGYNNTANGFQSLYSNTTGHHNVANGTAALRFNTTGNFNTANGAIALFSNTTGESNTANGTNALYSNTTGFNNTANGMNALYSNTTGFNNTANGMNALYYNQSATNTSAFGFEAAKGTAGYSNRGGVYVGYQSGYSAGTGSDYNSFVGYQSGYNTIDGTYNTALGYRALYSATSSDNVVAIGREAMYNFTAGNYYSTAIGAQALYTATSSIGNTAVGYQALYANTTGFNNVAVGEGALSANTIGQYNTAVGRLALYSNTTGSQNAVLSGYGLWQNTTGSNNVAIGGFAVLGNNLTGSNNIAIGSLNANTTGNNSVGVGYQSLFYNQSATNTTALGQAAGRGTANHANQGGTYVGYQSAYNIGNGGDYNSFVGYQSGYNTIDGTYNTALGYRALYNATSSDNVVAIGREALYNAGDTDGTSIAVGYRALYSSTGFVNGNTAVGYESQYGNTTGIHNTSLGLWALKSNTTANYNTSIGMHSMLLNTTGGDNTALGAGALQNNTTGYYNTASGRSALSSNTTGYNNTANGVNALFSNTTGYNNTGVGMNALYYNQSATNTTAIGYAAGQGTGNYYNQGGVYVGYQAGYNAATSSDYNTMLGYQSGRGVTTGANNILLGYNAGYSGTNLTTGSNNIIIGHNIGATSTGMTRGLNIGNLIFGTGLDGSGTTLSTGNVGIGNSAPIVKLHIGSTAITDGTSLLRLEDSNSACSFTADSGSPSCGSDRTLKKNIETLATSDVLRKVAELNLITYNWKTDSDSADKQTGFIAQEVRDIFPELVSESTWIDGSKKLFLNTGGMVPYLVGAVQALNLKIADLEQSTTSMHIGYTYEYDDAGLITKTIAFLGAFIEATEARFEKLFAEEVIVEKDVQAEGSVSAGKELRAGEQVCIDDVCINKDQLRELLEREGMNAGAPQGGVQDTTPTESDDSHVSDISEQIDTNDTSAHANEGTSDEEAGEDSASGDDAQSGGGEEASDQPAQGETDASSLNTSSEATLADDGGAGAIGD